MEIIGNINTTESPITITVPALLNAGGTPSVLSDLFANQPAAGTAGRLFIATDTGVISRDTGAGWTAIGGSATPAAAGTQGQVQFNNANLFAGAGNVLIDGGDLVLELQNTPGIPPADTVKIFNRQVGGRNMIAQVGPSGLDTALQPLLARNKVGFWCPPGNATTVPGVFGFTAYTASGTATTRNVATTNLFTRMRRLGYVSANGAGSLCGARAAVAQITTGITFGAVPTGGFFKVIRFGCSDASAATGARQFVGISSNTGAPTNVEPSTLTNSIGVGHGAANTNLFLYFGGSTAQTPINLGVNFPANTLSIDAYELALFCAPGVQNSVGWQVTRINTGDTVSGTLTAATPGVQLPANTTLLTYSQSWRTNNATSGPVGLDIFSDYIETDQ